MTHCPEELIRLFNEKFQLTENTILVRGGDEPLYLPQDESCPHDRVIFARGFFTSALHEISHWCIAGEARRRWVDYGYWYRPDGRSALEQQEFERVEVKPQALEWLFTEATGHRFRVSLDNLSGESSGNSQAFCEAVCRQALAYLQEGMPSRAATWLDALLRRYRCGEALSPDLFVMSRL